MMDSSDNPVNAFERISKTSNGNPTSKIVERYFISKIFKLKNPCHHAKVSTGINYFRNCHLKSGKIRFRFKFEF